MMLRSNTLRWTRMRDRAQQSWPALSNTEYGADAVRWFMLSDSPPERDLEWSEAGIEGITDRGACRGQRCGLVVESAEGLHVAGTRQEGELVDRGVRLVVPIPEVDVLA